MRNRLRLRLTHFFVLEAALVGLFFISSTRFLVGMVYSRAGGASVVLSLDPASIPANMPGVVDSTTFTNEISFLVYMLALPLITLILGRFRWLTMIAGLLVAAGRWLMTTDTPISPVIAASMVFGGTLLYFCMLVRFRASILPYLFVLGIGADQVFRAAGNTLDPSWSPSYSNIQLGLSVALAILVTVTTLLQGGQRRNDSDEINQNFGLMPFWAGFALGALLFLEMSLLALPNAVAGRSSYDYTSLAPFITLATLLPLIPAVRQQAGNFVALFDRSVRGWLWMLLLALLIVFGTRFQGVIAAAALVLAQFMVSLLWWWLVRPRAEKERQFSALWLIVAVFVFALLAVADNFTYEYGYVQAMPADLAFLNPYIPPFLRAFRGMGLGILLLTIFLAVLPMIQTRRRIPWVGGSRLQSFFSIIVVVATCIGVAVAVRPPVIQGKQITDESPLVRIATFNIHSGFNEFYHFDMEAIARTILSGADVVLLQQVDSGRLTSFGVDQSLWLARRLGMGVRFFPTNEGLQGLALLSKIPIVTDEGILLSSVGNQTGVQRVQIQPKDGTLITLYNTRLEYLLANTADGRSADDQEQEQQRQLNEIFGLLAGRFAEDQLGRLVVGGTFNNVPDSPLGDQMRKAGFIDPFAGTGLPIELTATFSRTGYPQVRFDYLWLWRRSLVPNGVGTVDSTASDHRMVAVDVFVDTASP
ncbi:MAG: endonuclease/exonuclease/phosphatase family protein [Anaerolineae bacterium]